MQVKLLQPVFSKLHNRINPVVHIGKCMEDTVEKIYNRYIYKDDSFSRHDEQNFNLHSCGFVILKLFPSKKDWNAEGREKDPEI